jgi:hypothetical protein
VSEVLPDMDPEVAAGLRQVLETGEPIKDVEVVGETPSQPGRARTWLCSWYPVRSRSGDTILGIGAIVLEVTQRVRTERRNAFLARVGEALAETLDWEDTLARVAAVAIPDKSDACVVHLQDEAGLRVQRLLAVHRDPELQQLGDELHERWATRPGADQEIARVLRTGTPSFVREVTPDVERAAEHEDQIPLLRRLDLTSWIVVPMTARGRTLGTLSFAMSGSGRHFDDDDFELALDIARRAAAAVDNARLYRERDHIAKTLQRSLLPPRCPTSPASRSPRATGPPARRSTSAATSTTSSRGPAAGRSSSGRVRQGARGRRPDRAGALHAAGRLPRRLAPAHVLVAAPTPPRRAAARPRAPTASSPACADAV